MIYFYAGLGATMMTGIMMLFEIGLALTGQSLLEERPEHHSYQDVVNSDEQLFLKMLTQQSDLQAIGKGRNGIVLCQQILCRIEGTGCRTGNMKSPLYASLDGYSIQRSTHSSGVWASSCIFEREINGSGLTHRLLIIPNRERFQRGYEMYSCSAKGQSIDQRCLFESGA